MKNSVRKMFPLAVALLLALCGAAVAGDNENVVISLDKEHAVAGNDENVQVTLSAAGLVGVNQFEVTLTVSPPGAFKLEATTFDASGFEYYSPGVEFLGDGQIKIGAATLNGPRTGASGLGVLTLRTSDNFLDFTEDADTQIAITVSSAFFGASSEDQENPLGDYDPLNEAQVRELGLRLVVNQPVYSPTLMASIAPPAENPYSEIGDGAVGNGSPGELEFAVEFRDHKEKLTKDQVIAWDISNAGPESVYLLSGEGQRGVEIPAGGQVSLRNVTDEGGKAAIQFDSEGNLKAAATSLGVQVSTIAENSAGEMTELEPVGFNTTWMVPGDDILMFADQVYFQGVPLEDSGLGDVVIGIAGAGEVIAGAGTPIPVMLSADGLKNDVKQVEVILTVSPPDAFNLAATGFEVSDRFSLAAPAMEVSGNQVRGGAVVTLGGEPVNGNGVELGTFTLVTSESFNEETEAEIVIRKVSLGSASDMRDYLDDESGLLDLRVHLNRPDPVLVATGPGNDLGNVSLGDVWPVGNADVSDDESSEIEYSVNFTNHWGDRDLSADQLIVWDVFNRSMHSVDVDGIGRIPAEGSVYVRNTTDEMGDASIKVDAAAEAFLSIKANTEIQNAAGKTLNLKVDFSAAWAAAKQVAAVPLANSLSQNYPNPFNPETTIRYDLSSDAIVSLTIYNITGQVVRKLVDGESLAAGQYQAVWDGRSESGASVASGMYFYLLHAGDYVAKRKMVLLR